MDAEFLEEYLKSPEEHLRKFIDENYELRNRIVELENKLPVVPLPKGKTVEENELLETIVVNLNKNNNGWSISKEQIIRMLKIMTSSNITNIIEPMISKEKVV